MPYKDPEKAKETQRERARRYRQKKHAERYGEGAGPQGVKHGNHARGPRNGKWNHGRLLSSHGYILVRVGVGHPLGFGNGYAYEHDLVMVAFLGRPLAPDEIVHHKNQADKTDNRIGNLELKTGSEHMALHIVERERDTKGRLLPARVREFPRSAVPS